MSDSEERQILYSEWRSELKYWRSSPSASGIDWLMGFTAHQPMQVILCQKHLYGNILKYKIYVIINIGQQYKNQLSYMEILKAAFKSYQISLLPSQRIRLCRY